MILFAKLCYGLPHCGCKLCYQPPLKRLSEVNFISIADIEKENVETAPEIDNISYKERQSDLRFTGLSKKHLTETEYLHFIFYSSDFCVKCKGFRAAAVTHRHPSKDTQGHVNYFILRKNFNAINVSSHHASEL